MKNTVKITFKTYLNSFGNVKRTSCIATIENIVVDYGDGTVQVESGDVFKVVPCKDNSAKYFAVA